MVSSIVRLRALINLMNLSDLTFTFPVKNHLFCFISSSHHHAAVLSFRVSSLLENLGCVFIRTVTNREVWEQCCRRLIGFYLMKVTWNDDEIKATQTLGIMRLCSCSLEFSHENFWEPLDRLDHQSWIFYFPENEGRTWRSLFNASALLWLSRSSNAAFKMMMRDESTELRQLMVNE